MADVVHLADYRPVPLSAHPTVDGSVILTLGQDEHEEHLSLKQARRFLGELADAIDTAEHLARAAKEAERR